jgi:colicin import membrane protein
MSAEAENTEMTAVANLLESFKDLTALEQATFLKQAAVVHERAVRAAIKEATSAPKRKRMTPEEKAAKAALPKKEQPAAVKAWLDFVQLVFADMKEADAAAKYGDAMAEAKKRRDEGTDPRAPAKVVKEVKAPKEKKPKAEGVAPKKVRKTAIATVSPDGSVASAPTASTVSSKLSKEEKAALKAEKDAAKAAAKEEAAAAKAAEKAAKAAAAAAEKAAKEQAKADEKAAKEIAAAAAKAAKEAEKAAKAAAKGAKGKPSVASAAAAAAAPAPAPVQQEEESLTAWTHKGTVYYRSSMNECWLKAADGSMGAWVGLYNPVTDKVEAAPEPEFE